MKERLKLISLNVELNRHLDTVLPFLVREKADVICLQEVVDRDLPRIEKELGLKAFFVPMSIPDFHTDASGSFFRDPSLAGTVDGLALFSPHPVKKSGASYYHGDSKSVPLRTKDYNRMLLWATVFFGGMDYTIGTTHFTWTPDGKADDLQREDVKKLLEITKGFSDIVFCGDFNAPRGGEIWAKVSEHYRDNIPEEHDTSIDPQIHRVKNLIRMVDGLFSTPEYIVSGVKLVEGVSDHKAVVGYIERISNS